MHNTIIKFRSEGRVTMATSREYLNFILEQLQTLSEISYRPMMSEYILYYRGRPAAYVCDDRLLVKPTPSALAFLREHIYEPPYEGAKAMLLVSEVDDAAALTGLFEAIFDELPPPKAKKR